MPRSANREIHSDDFLDTSADKDVLDFEQLRLTTLTGADIVVTSEREFKDAVEFETFMADKITIVVSTTTDKNAPLAVAVGVQGENVWLPRGRKVRIPRRFVERLARSQAIGFATSRNQDPNVDDAMHTRRTTASDYPFSVLHDPSPKGEAWLRRVMAESR